MRLIVCALVTASAVFAFGCSGNKQAETTSSTTTAPAATMAAATTGVVYLKLSEVPSYPGATIIVSSSPVRAIRSITQGKVMSTTDSFDKVYAWYKSKLPPGSDKGHVRNGDTDVANFIVGDPLKNTTTISLTSNGLGKVTIGTAMRQTL